MSRCTRSAVLAVAAGLVLSTLTFVGGPAQAAQGDASISATPRSGLGEYTIISVRGNAGPKSVDNNGSDPGGAPDTLYPPIHIVMCASPSVIISCDTSLTNFGMPVSLHPGISPHVVAVTPNQATGGWGPVNFLVRRKLVNAEGTVDCVVAQCAIRTMNLNKLKDRSYDATQNLGFIDPSSPPKLTSGPTVTGGAAVGKRLTCAATYENATSQSFRWLRGGATIAGASASTYTATAADYRKGVACASSAANSVGISDESVSAARTIGLGAALKATTKPKVTGTFRVGRKLTATKGTWSPAAATYTYRWLRDGKAIANATKVRYKLKKADKGSKVSVRVTARKQGHASGASRSAATKVRA